MAKRPSITQKPAVDWFTRILLAGVMLAALAMGTWSMFTLLTDYMHAPWQIAAFGCAMFDGAALFFARLSQQYATSPDSGAAPRLSMFLMILTSSGVNAKHAQMNGWGPIGMIILGAAPVIAELAFEQWHKYEHKGMLRRLGRIAERMPSLGGLAWVLHPGKATGVVNSHVEARMIEVRSMADARIAAARGMVLERGEPGEPGEGRVLERVDRDEPVPVAAVPQHVVITVQQQPVALPAGQPVAVEQPVTPVVPVVQPEPVAAVVQPEPVRAEPVAAVPVQPEPVAVPVQPEPQPVAPAPEPEPEPEPVPVALRKPEPEPEPEPVTPQPEPVAALPQPRKPEPEQHSNVIPLALEGVSKAEAVRRASQAMPHAEPADLARLLTSNGVETSSAYVRTTLSRMRKAAGEEQAAGPSRRSVSAGEGGYH